MNVKVLKKRKIGLICCGILTLLMVVVFVQLLFFGILDTPKLLGIGVTFVFVDLYVLLTQLTNKMYKIGIGIAVVLSIVLLALSLYLFKTTDTLGSTTGKTTQVDELSVIVLADEKATKINEIVDYTFGIYTQTENDTVNTNAIIEEINEECETKITTAGYTDVLLQVKALYSGEVKAIIMNEAMRGVILETYEDFDKETKKIYEFEKETKVDIITEEEDNQPITKTPFNIYISGIDSYGPISKKSRSDVNIIATVDPVSKQILLTSTPRDYYVATTVSKGVEDKLTHAGIYGVDCSVGTLEEIYGIDINYYVRVNFTGFVDVVDALGGVTVHSDFNFTSDWGPSFKKGNNKVNGEQALAFARERHTFAAGDIQRGKNQQYLIKAIFEKATSPSIITNFNGLMDSVKENVETSIPASKVTELLKMQLNGMDSWNIVMINASGTNGSEKTFTSPSENRSVIIPDTDSIEVATQMMKDVLNHKKVTDDQYKTLFEAKKN